MSPIAKILIAFIIVFVIFATSGLLAQFVLSTTGCLWTSTASFGLTFLTLCSAVAGLISHMIDISHWF